jgi:ectoine hydroxylase-related dioxygenase (phytanoyl-CoA dioxygenase family)
VVREDDAWRGLVVELEAPAGLLYAGRIRCPRGEAMQLMAWEPALRAIYNGRPRYDPARIDLRDVDGAPLDTARAFTLGEDRERLAHFLRTAGYLVVRGVFDASEVGRFRDEAQQLASEARKGDRLSWWGKNAAGEEVCCRVTRANEKTALGSLPTDVRILGLVALSDHQPLVHYKGEGHGVTLIYKRPDMVEGLSNLPWHRDCGMGGHAAICPRLIVSVFLSPANPETGDLVVLPGSHLTAVASFEADDARAPRGVRLLAGPGDVVLHYSDTMHAAPEPTGKGLDAYRISATVDFARPGAGHHRGENSYNDVLHQREDGQIENLRQVAKKV